MKVTIGFAAALIVSAACGALGVLAAQQAMQT